MTDLDLLTNIYAEILTIRSLFVYVLCFVAVYLICKLINYFIR